MLSFTYSISHLAAAKLNSGTNMDVYVSCDGREIKRISFSPTALIFCDRARVLQELQEVVDTKFNEMLIAKLKVSKKNSVIGIAIQNGIENGSAVEVVDFIRSQAADNRPLMEDVIGKKALAEILQAW
ncbi:MAG: hypothetical protein LCH51_07895 [Bacteroidetes bacterium]|nr:hypothetical protein [Bacteroidota bacterium]